MNSARLDLRLPPELLARVKEAAGDGSVNAWVRDALELKVAMTQIAPVLKLRTEGPTLAERTEGVKRTPTVQEPDPKPNACRIPAKPPTNADLVGRPQPPRRAPGGVQQDGPLPKLAPTNADLGARNSAVPPPGTGIHEIPLPKIAPRRWGK